MEVDDRQREAAAEAVVAEEKSSEVKQRGEVRDGAGEGVVLQAKDAELVEAVEGPGGEETSDAGVNEDDADDAAGGGAGDSRPAAVVGGVIGRGWKEGKAVTRVGRGLEREESGAVGGSAGGGQEGSGAGEEKQQHCSVEHCDGATRGHGFRRCFYARSDLRRCSSRLLFLSGKFSKSLPRFNRIF